MSEVVIRNVQPKDLEECYVVEIATFPPEEAAVKETIQLRIDNFPEGFFVAELDGRVVGMVNGASTEKDDISDEELKQLIGHDIHGKNMVIFALGVLPEFQRQGIAKQLALRFIEEAKKRGKHNVLLMCKTHLIDYYKRLGFEYAGLSKSTHGGAEWHNMRLSL
jgi:ribosomal protein S18 acetylase RimI-like enzyme